MVLIRVKFAQWSLIFHWIISKKLQPCFGNQLVNATVFAFHGDMGAGKTTFIHALCDVKGVKDVVGSPTFSIINEYVYTDNGDEKKIFHIDLYRLKDEEEAIQAGVEDCLYSDHICLVEWPERAPGIFPEDTVHVYIDTSRFSNPKAQNRQELTNFENSQLDYSLTNSMSQQKPKISTSFSYETLEETLDIKPKAEGMMIGIPKEIAFQENRIALTPDAVSVLVSNGHQVVIEHNAGEASHFRDKDYSEAGAKIVYDRAEVYKAPILVKSAPVIEEDLPLLQMNQVIISPIHLSVLKAELLEKMMEKKITAISFENLKDDSDSYPIVRSMSEIAGSAVMLIAAQYLGSANHGKGVLLGGISGIAPTKVIIIGAGIVGEYAARAALGTGSICKSF